MRRLLGLLLALVAIAAPAAAQTSTIGIPASGLMPPVIVFPASAVNGAGTVTSPQLLLPDGTTALPGVAFASQTDLGIQRASAGVMRMQSGSATILEFNATNGLGLGGNDTFLARGGAAGKVSVTGATPMIQLGGTTSSFPAFSRSGAVILVRLADDSGYTTIAGGFSINPALYMAASGGILISNTAPTISSGFGTSPSIASNNGTAAFTVNVGTGGVATSGVIGLPTATTGWNCQATDITTNSATVFITKQTASSTTTATIGNFNTAAAAAAWVASDILRVSCFAY